jgi:hypothetical protein
MSPVVTNLHTPAADTTELDWSREGRKILDLGEGFSFHYSGSTLW